LEIDEEVLIDGDVRAALDEHLLTMDGVTGAPLYGGIGYLVDGRPFAVLLEGVLGMRLPDDLQRRSLGLAGVSPLRPPSRDEPIPGWVQFVLLLPEDLPEVAPWIQEALENVR
jgi:hypothetical protein